MTTDTLAKHFGAPQLDRVDDRWSLTFYNPKSDGPTFRVTFGEWFRTDPDDYRFEWGDVDGVTIRLVTDEQLRTMKSLAEENDDTISDDIIIMTKTQAMILQLLLDRWTALNLIVNL